MNVSANVLGLGNAATPFGLEAIRRLDELNPHKGTATDAQAMLCALNTASVQLIPASVIALRVAAGSKAPTEIIGATIVASGCGLVAAVAAARLLAGFFPPPPPDPDPEKCGADGGAVARPSPAGPAAGSAGVPR
jgi:spore maturation protein A